MTAQQGVLDGMPEPEPDDYMTWVETVRPTFVQVAQSRRRHWLVWEIKREYKLPDPPDPAHDWGRFTTGLQADGVVQHDGFGLTRDKSCVHAWRGTRAARSGRAA